MNIKDAIYTYLITQTGLTALVGLRIYPMRIPQRLDMPAITFEQVSKVCEHTMGSDSGNPFFARWQFNCWADTNYGADDVAAQLITALKDYSGTLGGEGGISVDRILYENETELFDENMIHSGISVDFTIIYRE